MAIRPNQRRVTIIMDNDDYEMVARAAKADRRSVSSYCNNVIMCFIDGDSITCSPPVNPPKFPSKKRTYKLTKNPTRVREKVVF